MSKGDPAMYSYRQGEEDVMAAQAVPSIYPTYEAPADVVQQTYPQQGAAYEGRPMQGGQQVYGGPQQQQVYQQQIYQQEQGGPQQGGAAPSWVSSGPQHPAQAYYMGNPTSQSMQQQKPQQAARQGYEVHNYGHPDPYWANQEAKWDTTSKPTYMVPPPKLMGQSSTGKMSYNSGQNSQQDAIADEAPAAYQDWWAAVLFLGHLAVMLWCAFGLGLPILEEDAHHSKNEPDVDANIANDSIIAIVSGSTICCLAAAAFSYLWLKYILKNAKDVITFMLWASIGVQLATAVGAIFSGQLWLFIMSLIFAAMSFCYYRLVRNRIPFAATNLAVATRAIGSGSGPILVSFGMMFVQLLWQFIWCLATIGAVLPRGGYSIDQGGMTYSEVECETRYDTRNGIYVCLCQHQGVSERPTLAEGQCHYSTTPGFLMFLLLVSAFWGSLVIQYIVHCTTAGVVSEFWYTGNSKNATWPAFKRACTTSFGSICFGSLFLAVIRAVHQMLQEMRKSENNTCVALAECLLMCIDGIATYFNRYAFTFVAMYGTGFVESGKNAVELFKRKGLSAVINDQLISNTFLFASFGSSVVIALLGYGFSMAFALDGAYRGLMAGIGFLAGMLVCSIVLGTIDSAVATVFVCWAEAPEALQSTAPDLFVEMTDSWTKALQEPSMQ